MRRHLFLIGLLVFTASLRAEVPPLLAEVVEHWGSERGRWTFTQLVKEYDGAKVAEERVERYDISRGDARRWELVSINGRKPTPEELAPWNKRKNRARLFSPRPIGDYVDLAHARVVNEDERSVSFEIPLSRTMAWLLPEEKISLVVTIDKQTRALERGRVELGGPFSIALGLAKVIDLDVDLELPAGEEVSTAGAAQAKGSGYAVVNKLGRRIEYTWMDFARTPAAP